MSATEAQTAQAWLDARFSEQWPQYERGIFSPTSWPRPMIQALRVHPLVCGVCSG